MKKIGQKFIALMLAMTLCVSIVSFAVPSLYASSGDNLMQVSEASDSFEVFNDSVLVKNSKLCPDGIRVTVKAEAGVFPKDAQLHAKFASAKEQKKVEKITENALDDNLNVAAAYTIDVKIFDKTGEYELQPSEGKKVWVSFSLPEVANENLTTHVFHMKEHKNSLKAEELKVKEDSETATVKTDGFSYYTVEFTYNNIEFVLPGDWEIKLEDLLDKVGISGEIDSWEVSNPELFDVFLGAYYGVIYESADESIPTNEGEIPWLLSLQPFDTTEWLKVVVDGVEYEITVTDDNTSHNLPENHYTDGTTSDYPVSTYLDNDSAVTTDYYYQDADKPSIVKQGASTTSCTDFAAGLPLSTIFIDTSKVGSTANNGVIGNFTLLTNDQTFRDGITLDGQPLSYYVAQGTINDIYETIPGRKVAYNPTLNSSLKQISPNMLNELSGPLYQVVFEDVAVLPENHPSGKKTAHLKITYSNAKIAVDERLSVTDTASGLTASNYQGEVLLSNGASISYDGSDKRYLGTSRTIPNGYTNTFTQAQRNAMAAAVKTTAGKYGFSAGGGTDGPMLGHSLDVTYQIIDDDGNPIDGTFIFAMAGINLDRDPFMPNSNNYGKPLWYYNKLGGVDTDGDGLADSFPNEYLHFFSESVILNSGIVSDYIYVRPNTNIEEPNEKDKNVQQISYYYPEVLMEGDAVRFIGNGGAIGKGSDYTYSTGFVCLADANTGMKITAFGHGGGGGNMNTQVFSAKKIWYRYISTTGLNGNIQTTSEGNYDGTLNDTSDSSISSKILDPGTYVVPEGKTVTYTMTPMTDYQISKLMVTNSSGELQEIKVNGNKPLSTMQPGQTLQFRDAGNQICTLTALADGKFKLDMPYAMSDEKVHVEWERVTAQITVKKTAVNDVNGTFRFKIKARKNEDVNTYTPTLAGSIYLNQETSLYNTSAQTGVTFNETPDDLALLIKDVELVEKIEIGAGEFLWKTDKLFSELGIVCRDENNNLLPDDYVFVGFQNAPSAIVGDTLDYTLNTSKEVIYFYHPHTLTTNVTTYWDFQNSEPKSTEQDWYYFNLNTNGETTLIPQKYYSYEIYEETPIGWELVSVDGDLNKTGASGTLADQNTGPIHTFHNLKRLELKVNKKVAGTGGSRNKYFKFTVTLTNCEPGTTLAVDLSGANASPQTNSETTYTNMTNPSSIAIGADGTGTATFYLRHDEYIIIKGLLVQGAGYTVTEDYENYQPSLAITGDTTNAQGAIPTGDNVYTATDNSLALDYTVLTFTNRRNLATPTGVFMQTGVAVTALLAAFVLMVVFLFITIRRFKNNSFDIDEI